MSVYFYKHWGQLPRRPGRGTLTQKWFLSLYLHRGNKDDSKINRGECKTGHNPCPEDVRDEPTRIYTPAQDDCVLFLAAFLHLKQINFILQCTAILESAAYEPHLSSNGWFYNNKVKSSSLSTQKTADCFLIIKTRFL